MKRDLNRQWKQYEYKLQDEFRFAAMIALNDASFAMRGELGKHAEETFDKGASNFTKNAFIVSSRATKKNLASDVVAKDIQAAYMIPAINGGTRRKGDPATSKASIVVPGKAARLNKQGNLGRGYLRKQTARPDTFVGSAVIKGKRQLGVFKRKITKAKNTLQVLALFKSKVTHRPVDFDIMKVSNQVYDRVVTRSMNEAINDLAVYGRVRTSNKRK